MSVEETMIQTKSNMLNHASPEDMLNHASPEGQCTRLEDLSQMQASIMDHFFTGIFLATFLIMTVTSLAIMLTGDEPQISYSCDDF